MTQITHYTIYGERHSGTKLLEKIIDSHFRLICTWQYGWKHFFGHYKDGYLRSANNTLFLCIVRNPYDWLSALYKEPHHLQRWYYNNDNSIRNPFKSMENFLTEQVISYTTPTINKEYMDQSSVSFQEIMADRNIITNERYNNIFELRADKLRYIYELNNILNNLLIINYENILTNYMSIVYTISQKFNTTITDTHPLIDIEVKKPYMIDNHIHNIINKSIDWNIENKFGYDKK